jgi:hypothetical protein
MTGSNPAPGKGLANGSQPEAECDPEPSRPTRGSEDADDLVVRHLERVAWRWLLERDEGEYSFVDATSFAFMRQQKVTTALAFDGDFSAAGFVELRPETGH